MKLLYSPFSPFVRKVMASAHHLGLADQIDLLERTVNPLERKADIEPYNPLGKIPAVVLEDGTTLIDSRTICEYFDSLKPEGGLFPKNAARWAALRVHALADGLIEAALLVRIETGVRPEPLQWPDWCAGQTGKIKATIAALEQEVGNFGSAIDIGAITVGCALGYLDFRLPHYSWRADAPHLADWWAEFSQLPIMAKTAA